MDRRKFNCSSLGLFIAYLCLQVLCLNQHFAYASEELQITRLVVPPHVKLHENVTLECHYNLPPSAKLLQIMWKHNLTDEFYRYSFDDAQPKKEFANKAAIKVDLKQSSDTLVVIKNISLLATGVFECIIYGLGPDFDEDSRQGNLTVVVIPSKKPQIFPAPSEGLRVGSSIVTNCTAAPSIPAATLQWHVNDQTVSNRSLKYYPVETTKTGLRVSRLGLHFKVTKKHYNTGQISVKCTASISTLYNDFDEHNHQTMKNSYKDSNPQPSVTGDAPIVSCCWCVLLAAWTLQFLITSR